MEFINAKNVPTREEKLKIVNVNTFISLINHELKNGDENGDDSFSLNTELDDIPMLSQKEFDHCLKKAKNQGWELTQFNDEHQTITYKIRRI